MHDALAALQAEQLREPEEGTNHKDQQTNLNSGYTFVIQDFPSGRKVERQIIWQPALPGDALKLSAAQATQLPFDAPPHPLRYWPAAQREDAVEQEVQLRAPVKATDQQILT